MVQTVAKAVTSQIVSNMENTKKSPPADQAKTPPPSIAVPQPEEKETGKTPEKQGNAEPVKLIDMEDSQNPTEDWIQRPAAKKKKPTPFTPKVPNSGYTSSSSSDDELEVVEEKPKVANKKKPKTPKMCSKSKTLKKNTPKKKVVDSSSSSDSDSGSELEFDDDKDLKTPKKTDVVTINKTLGLKQLKDFYFQAFMRHASGRFANDAKWLMKKIAPQLYAIYRQRGGQELEEDEANDIKLVSNKITSLTSSKRSTKRSHRNISKDIANDTKLSNLEAKKPKITPTKAPKMKHTLIDNTPPDQKVAKEMNWQMYVKTLKNKWEKEYSSIPMPSDMNSPFLNLVAITLHDEIKALRKGLTQEVYHKHISN